MIEAKKDTVSLSSGYSFKYGIPFDSASVVGNHKKLADILIAKECEVASVVIVVDRLDERHWSDPNYMRQSHELGACEVELDARRIMQNRYPAIAEIEALMRKVGISQVADNFSKGKKAEDQNNVYHSKALDAMFEAYTLSKYPEIIESRKQNFRDDWKEEKKKGDWQVAWEAELLRILYPSSLTTYQRVYKMPEPFDHWDSRNSWQQFYLVGYQRKIGWVSGGSAGSIQREQHGRWAHTFAALADIGIEAPTYCYRYTSENEFKLEKSYEKFRCVRQDLTGNYSVSWEDTKELFIQRLLSTNNGKVTEIRHL